MRLRETLILTAAMFGVCANAGEEHACAADPQITVEADTPELAARVCDDAQAGLDVLRQCGVTVGQPIAIRLRETLPPGCVGEFHCGTGEIDLLNPATMSEIRKADSPLSHVGDRDYFRSILTHELAHAAYDVVPCPYPNCRATSEYLGHAFQIMSLSDADRATFEAALDMDTHMPRDALNAFIYMMSPNSFLQKTWIHLNQRPDPCAYVTSIMSGQIFMDQPHF